MSGTRLNEVKECIDSCDHDLLRDVILNIVDIFDKASALIYAVKCAARPSVRVLLDAGCDPCLRYEGRTALYWTVVVDDTDTLDLLLADFLWLLHSNQHSFMEPDNLTYNNALSQASTHVSPHSPQAVQNSCFSFCGLGHKRTDFEKQLAKVERAVNTTLFEAACHASVRCAEMLLNLGANVNAFHYHDDEILSWCSALISACAAPITNAIAVDTALQMAELLVRYGADITAANCYGQTALHWAARSGLVSVLPVLLRNGADIDARDKMGQTALMSACDRAGAQCVDVCSTLIKWGADMSCRGDKDDYTAFHYAVGNNSEQLVRLFLEVGVCPTTGTRFKPISDKHCAYVAVNHGDSLTWQQLTPLDIAVNNNQIAMVKCLLRAYADVNAPSIYNQTVTPGGGLIYLASESPEITELLIHAGFDRHICFLVSKNRYFKGPTREVLNLSKEVSTLRHQCRLTVRRMISPNYVRCQELPLPSQLLRYINMEDLLC